MALATISARVDAYDKADFDKFCSNVGINASTAINMFIKAVLKERRIPFDLYDSEKNEDPFYSEENMKRLRKSIDRVKKETSSLAKNDDPFYSKENIDYVLKSVKELRAGLGTPHELIEV